MLDISQKVRTLGLYQPYAGLMLHGKVETRYIRGDRKPPFPLGLYLIYATKKSYEERDWQTISSKSKNIITRIRRENDPDLHLRGQALCLAELVEVIDPIRPVIHDAKTFVDVIQPSWEGRMVGLRFESVCRIKPFQIAGKQGIGYLTDEERAKIEFV